MIEELKDIYTSWNNKELQLVDKGNHIEITTPFVDMHHDFLQLVFSKELNNRFKISDDGYIVNELELLGIDLKKSGKRREFFSTTLKIFGIQFNPKTNELWTSFERLSDYPSKQINLLQCIMRVSDMLMTSRNNIKNIFFQDVCEYFELNDVIYSPNIGITGRTGNENKFDFVIPKIKLKQEQIIRAINTPSSDNFKYPLLSFIDVQETRPEAQQIVLANDLDMEVSEKFRSSFENYNIKVLRWSEKDRWIGELQII